MWSPSVVGNMPFLFGFAATRDKFEWSLLSERGRESIAGPFNLKDIEGRFAVVRSTINVFRLVRALYDANCIPNNVLRIFR